ncbi:MAG: Trk family potassium uptake protein [Lachnospiraceae bacterium]|nr:Trk family potassium uptake protein [Lachnospiraceae bacterium]
MKPSGIKWKLTSGQIIILGFAAVILIGSLLLMLPFATQGPDSASFLEALFTATSAVCVTGLIVQDTATYWSFFGQLIIITLIQIGGLGVVTVASAIAMMSGKKIGLMQRSTMQEAISAPQVGGIVRLTAFILKMTFIFELTGAICMATVFIPQFGFVKGVWYSIFHSISAFCNAGFDLMGVNAPYSSLTAFSDNTVINLTIMLLIIIGGIGFLTWEEVVTKKLQIKKYRMQSKVVLTVSAFLIVLPAIYFYFGEFSGMVGKERVLNSLFQAVTPRTAGFNTADLTKFSETGIMVMTLLMLIGGSPGSTAGGMKTTTVATLLGNAIRLFRREDHTHFYGRRVPEDVMKNAAAILLMYLVLCVGGAMVISRVEEIAMLTCLFETASAVGTVGLTLGITPELGTISRLILILLMYLGRVGGLTVIFAAVSGTRSGGAKFPQEKMTVG